MSWPYKPKSGTKLGADMFSTTLNQVHNLITNNATFVVRYLSPNTQLHPTKRVTRQEIDNLFSCDMPVGFVYEVEVNDVLTPASGSKHATSAVESFASLDFSSLQLLPAMYLAADDDFSTDQISGPITEYFSLAREVLKPLGFPVGAYGSAQTCLHLVRQGLVEHVWLAQSYDWSMYKDIDPASTGEGYDLFQGPGGSIGSLQLDWCYASSSFEDCGFLLPPS